MRIIYNLGEYSCFRWCGNTRKLLSNLCFNFSLLCLCILYSVHEVFLWILWLSMSEYNVCNMECFKIILYRADAFRKHCTFWRGNKVNSMALFLKFSKFLLLWRSIRYLLLLQRVIYTWNHVKHTWNLHVKKSSYWRFARLILSVWLPKSRQLFYISFQLN